MPCCSERGIQRRLGIGTNLGRQVWCLMGWMLRYAPYVIANGEEEPSNMIFLLGSLYEYYKIAMGGGLIGELNEEEPSGWS